MYQELQNYTITIPYCDYIEMQHEIALLQSRLNLKTSTLKTPKYKEGDIVSFVFDNEYSNKILFGKIVEVSNDDKNPIYTIETSTDVDGKIFNKRYAVYEPYIKNKHDERERNNH